MTLVDNEKCTIGVPPITRPLPEFANNEGKLGCQTQAEVDYGLLVASCYCADKDFCNNIINVIGMLEEIVNKDNEVGVSLIIRALKQPYFEEHDHDFDRQDFKVSVHTKTGRLVGFELYGMDKELVENLSLRQSKLVKPNCRIEVDDVMGVVNARYTCNHTDKCNYLVGFLNCMYSRQSFEKYSSRLVLEAVVDGILPPIELDEGARSTLENVTTKIQHALDEIAPIFENTHPTLPNIEEEFAQYSSTAEEATDNTFEYLVLLHARIHGFKAHAELLNTSHKRSTTNSGKHEAVLTAVAKNLKLPTIPISTFNGDI
ncbi:unnamed protein product [Angiostrongylus costaricensis]|uniref:CST complex subunit TEN1 n=1 Tax=Angiostrongylus costaricensis TaxID=334426 RepID=A0A158PI82_ANGCS|nr:unnamed protein product [Angiostrongylus costaricensis]